MIAARRNRPSRVLALRHRSGRAKKIKAARTPLPPTPKMRMKGLWRTELEAPVVLTVSVDVAVAVPEIGAG
jgi:hypothetical protein